MKLSGHKKSEKFNRAQEKNKKIQVFFSPESELDQYDYFQSSSMLKEMWEMYLVIRRIKSDEVWVEELKHGNKWIQSEMCIFKHNIVLIFSNVSLPKF